MKRCIICFQELPLDHFALANVRRRIYRCKSCCRAEWRERAHAHPERLREKARRFYANHREEILGHRRQDYLANPDKYRAEGQLRKAVKLGAVTKQPCEVCGILKVEAHHNDYTKPFDVHWFCRQHHNHNRQEPMV